jgi:hypothetical protein
MSTFDITMFRSNSWKRPPCPPPDDEKALAQWLALSDRRHRFLTKAAVFSFISAVIGNHCCDTGCAL